MNSNEPIIFACVGALIALFSMLAIKVGLHIYGKIRFLMKYNSLPRLIDYDPALACTDTHTWQRVKLIIQGVEPGFYQACAKCGCIAGNPNAMLSKEAVEQMREIAERNARNAELEKEVKTKINLCLTRYLTQHFPEEINDTEFVQKLVDFGYFCLILKDEVHRTVAKENHLDDILDRSDWTEDHKGNA